MKRVLAALAVSGCILGTTALVATPASAVPLASKSAAVGESNTSLVEEVRRRRGYHRHRYHRHRSHRHRLHRHRYYGHRRHWRRHHYYGGYGYGYGGCFRIGGVWICN